MAALILIVCVLVAAVKVEAVPDADLERVRQLFSAVKSKIEDLANSSHSAQSEPYQSDLLICMYVLDSDMQVHALFGSKSKSNSRRFMAFPRLCN